MVCSLHSVTTGSRDRANVSLIIIIIIMLGREFDPGKRDFSHQNKNKNAQRVEND